MLGGGKLIKRIKLIKNMENNKATKNESTKEEKEMVLHFTKTFSDTAREPFLILNSISKGVISSDILTIKNNKS